MPHTPDVNSLQSVRPGFLTFFIPEQAMPDDEKRFRRQLTKISMKMSLLCEYEFVSTDNPDLYWCAVVRRVSVLNPNADKFAIVRLDRISSVFDNAPAGEFLRSHFNDILDELNPDETVVIYPRDSSFFPHGKLTIDSSPSGFNAENGEYFSSLEVTDILPDCAADDSIDALDNQSFKQCLPSFDDEYDDDEAIDRAKRKWVEAMTAVAMEYVMRFHEAPPMNLVEEQVRGRLQLRPVEASSIVVSGNMEIFLPGFNEMKIRMTPLARTLYILFLCHPEGIRLKDIADYTYELTEIYSMVKPGANEQLARESIESLVDPFGDSLQQKLSMTRKAIRRQILVDELAQQYIIDGDRGGVYRIAATNVTIPSFLKSLGR